MVICATETTSAPHPAFGHLPHAKAWGREVLAVCAAVALIATAVPSPAQSPPAPGWIEGPRPGCRVWNPEPRAGESVVWTGNCANGYAQGHGSLIWLQDRRQMDRFVGEYRDGKRTGRGVYVWADGERYEGEFRDDRRTGRGVYTWPNGDRYEGGFRNGILHGRGVMRWADGSRYDGEWQDNRAHGAGTKTEVDGTVHTGRWDRGCLRAAGGMIEAGVTSEECAGR